MLFLQAIFCLKGCDDRSRFFVTSTLCLVIFTLFSAIFASNFSLTFILLLTLTLILICSTKRRLHDARLNRNWQLVPGLLFLVTGIVCLLIDGGSSYYLLIFPSLSIALLLTYSSRNKAAKSSYHLGYYGPIDLSRYQEKPVSKQVQRPRIEPTLAATNLNVNVNSTINESFENNTGNDEYIDDRQVDVGELIRLSLLNNRKLQLGLIMSISLIFIVVLFISLFTSISKTNVTVTKVHGSEIQVISADAQINLIKNKKYLLSMPDNFNLYQTTYQGVIIHWQADNIKNGELWSITSANGDTSCQNISFNKGEPLRTTAVFVENNNNYFASFSPLDSKELIQALAARGKFSLCGYHFSLKGSQSVLGKNEQYAQYLAK